MDTNHPDPLGHADDGVTRESEALIHFREEAREARKRFEDAHSSMLMLLAGHLGKFLKVGDVVTRADRDLTMMLRVMVGRDNGATRYELIKPAEVSLTPGRDVIEAHWFAQAMPLRADGSHMARAVVIEAPLFPMPDPTDTLHGEAYSDFCDAFVDNWMCSTPETYQRLKPAKSAAGSR